MTIAAGALVRTYVLHGIGIEVLADDPAVLRAMDLRLSAYADVAGPPAEALLRLEFVSRESAGAQPVLGRPVYDTPYGSLYYLPGEDLLTGELGGVTMRCAAGKGEALITAREFSDRTLYFATHPVVTVALMELMERVGRFSLHAGCVADQNGNGVLICGPSGAGKSTLTLALARAGMEFLGDDTIFVTPSADGVWVRGFADAIGVGSFAAERFPELAPFAGRAPTPGFPKRLHRFEELLGRSPAAACQPRLMLFPEVAPERSTKLDPLDRGEALLRLAPDVLLTHEAHSRRHVSAIADLLATVDCYSVCSGHDLERAAELVRGLL